MYKYCTYINLRATILPLDYAQYSFGLMRFLCRNLLYILMVGTIYIRLKYSQLMYLTSYDLYDLIKGKILNLNKCRYYSIGYKGKSVINK